MSGCPKHDLAPLFANSEPYKKAGGPALAGTGMSSRLSFAAKDQGNIRKLMCAIPYCRRLLCGGVFCECNDAPVS